MKSEPSSISKFLTTDFLLSCFQDYLKVWKVRLVDSEYLLFLEAFSIKFSCSDIFWFLIKAYLLVQGLLLFSLIGRTLSIVKTLDIYAFITSYWDLLNVFEEFRKTFLSLCIVLDDCKEVTFSLRFSNEFFAPKSLLCRKLAEFVFYIKLTSLIFVLSPESFVSFLGDYFFFGL